MTYNAGTNHATVPDMQRSICVHRAWCAACAPHWRGPQHGMVANLHFRADDCACTDNDMVPQTASAPQYRARFNNAEVSDGGAFTDAGGSSNNRSFHNWNWQTKSPLSMRMAGFLKRNVRRAYKVER